MAPLLVLWILRERSSYGYEIKRALSDGGMAFWFGLADTSIYSALRTLEKHGHVRQVGVEQAGSRPPRTRYAITASGRRHYADLLVEAIETVRVPIAPIDVALAARGDLDRDTVDAALQRRSSAIAELRHDAEALRRAAPNEAIADRVIAQLDAEADWLNRLDPTSIT